MTALAKRVGRFALAYLAFEIAWAGPFTALAPLMGAIVFLPSAPIAWLPFGLAFYLAPKADIRPIVGCLLAGMVAGSLLAIQVEVFFSLIAAAGPPDTTMLPGQPFSWSDVAKKLPEALLICVPNGAFGGLVFRAVYTVLPLARLPDDALTASHERPEAPIDVLAASARPGRRLSDLAMRAGRFGLAYTAFEIVTAVGLMAIVLAQARSQRSSGGIALNAGLFFLAPSYPIAWLPLSLSLYLA